METAKYFELGIRFVKVQATAKMEKKDQEEEFIEFEQTCNILNIIPPISYEYIVSRTTYSDKFTHPLIDFKRDIFRAGSLTFSLFMLNTSPEKKMEKLLGDLKLSPNDNELNKVDEGIHKGETELKGIFEKWKINIIPIKDFIANSKTDPSNALKKFVGEIIPILEKYINEDDLPKNWKEKIDKSFDIRISALGASIDLNYLLKKWLKK